MEFSSWINESFVKWRGSSRKSVTEFARYVGVSQPVMSDWMNGRIKSPPSTESVIKLADKFGYEVFDVLGLPTPELSPGNSRLLLEASRDLSRALNEAGIDSNDPAFEKLFIEIFSKRGIKVEIID